MTESHVPILSPMDEHNARLLVHAHPPEWRNPTPTSRYHLVVIGAGTAGLVTAAAAAGLGARVALVEKHLMGGDCLNVGCVPSKSLLRSARAAMEVRRAVELGIGRSPVSVDFAAVMQRMRRIRAEISRVDSAERFTREYGVDVFLGEARFTSRRSAVVAGAELQFSRAVIATGARAATLPIAGLEETGYLTNETVFSLTSLPARLAVIGGGPIGCELAQAFRMFGSEVTVVEVATQILGKEDPDAAALVQRRMESDGVKFLLDAKTRGVRREGPDRVLRLDSANGAAEIRVDEILLGAGRTPNVEGFGLETAGVEYDAIRGIRVDDYLRTTNPNVYAAGDVCMDWKFTHAADFAARTVVRNALFSLGPLGRAKVSNLTMPWCTYTQPEVAHVGMYEREAQERGLDAQTFVQLMEHVDRAVVDGDTDGFVKVLAERRSGRILGATIVAPKAGDLISEVTMAMVYGVSLGGIANVIHPYPTMADAIRKIGDQYNKTRLTPGLKSWMRRYLAWRF